MKTLREMMNANWHRAQVAEARRFLESGELSKIMRTAPKTESTSPLSEHARQLWEDVNRAM